jgi:hypothetical protein
MKPTTKKTATKKTATKKTATKKTATKKATSASNKKIYSKAQSRATAAKDRMNTLVGRYSR